jgi:hypothetical protein
VAESKSAAPRWQADHLLKEAAEITATVALVKRS